MLSFCGYASIGYMNKHELEIFKKQGKKGGNATKKRYGVEYFRELAKKRWAKVPVDNRGVAEVK